MKAYKHLVKHSLSKGFTVSVFDGEEWQVNRSNKYQAIIDAIESVEESQLKIRNAEGDYMGWALIIPSLFDDETVADFSSNEFMENWFDNEYTV